MQNFVEMNPINLVLLCPPCLAPGFLDFGPKHLNNVLVLEYPHRRPAQRVPRRGYSPGQAFPIVFGEEMGKTVGKTMAPEPVGAGALGPAVDLRTV